MPLSLSLSLSRFTLDDQVSFSGYPTGNYWNGFDCPLFPRASAEAILSRFSAPDSNGYFSNWHFFNAADAPAYADCLAIWETEGSDSWFYIVAPEYVTDAESGLPIPCYGIGSGSWIWFDISRYDASAESE